MQVEKMRMVAAILKALVPVLWDIVDDIIDAREDDSDGGKKVTKSERQRIIMENVLDIPELIVKVIRDM